MSIFIGLDGEMSGSDIENGAALIQVGLAITTPSGDKIFSSLLNPGIERYSWDEGAESIHNISKFSVSNADCSDVVDKAAYTFLLSSGADPKARVKNVAVGWNVAGFDFPFFRKFLPHTFSLLSRRSLDLNALCFALEGREGGNFNYWKTSAKKYALEFYPEKGNFRAHDAGWDAITSLYSLKYLKNIIQNS